jgi:hypothetical protein
MSSISQPNTIETQPFDPDFFSKRVEQIKKLELWAENLKLTDLELEKFQAKYQDVHSARIVIKPTAPTKLLLQDSSRAEVRDERLAVVPKAWPYPLVSTSVMAIHESPSEVKSTLIIQDKDGNQYGQCDLYYHPGSDDIILYNTDANRLDIFRGDEEDPLFQLYESDNCSISPGSWRLRPSPLQHFGTEFMVRPRQHSIVFFGLPEPLKQVEDTVDKHQALVASTSSAILPVNTNTSGDHNVGKQHAPTTNTACGDNTPTADKFKMDARPDLTSDALFNVHSGLTMTIQARNEFEFGPRAMARYPPFHKIYSLSPGPTVYKKSGMYADVYSAMFHAEPTRQAVKDSKIAQPVFVRVFKISPRNSENIGEEVISASGRWLREFFILSILKQVSPITLGDIHF